MVAALTAIASAVGIGVAAPPIQADTTRLNVIVSQPTGTIAVGETITFPVRVENPGTDTATLVSVTSSLGDPVTCPTNPDIAGGDALLCSTDHVVTSNDVTNGTLDITVDAEATVSACNVGPLTPELLSTSGSEFEFTGTLEGGATVKGYQFDGSLKDANGNEAARFHIQVESNGAPAGSTASISGNDVTWQFDNVSDAYPPSRVRYVINAVSDGFVSGGTITTDGMPPVTNGAVNDATGFSVGYENQATGAVLLAEDQPDEVINANAGDTLTAGTIYNLTDTSVNGSEAPQYTVEYAFGDIAGGDRADFWYDQYGAVRYEQHLLSLDLTGCSSAPVNVSGTGSTSVNTWNPALTLVKNQPTGTIAVDQTIGYTFDVTNSGNVELANIALDDPLTADEACPSTGLAAGASMTCTATYAVTQSDVDSGSIDNTATVTGYLPDGTTTTSDTSTVSAPITTTGALTVTKTASPADSVRGDTIDYSILVTNTGDVTLSSVTVDDPMTTDESCPADPIAPGGSLTCTATYVITQADADAGTISNTATVTALDPSANPIIGDDTNVYAVSQNPGLVVTKSASPAGATLGDTITYSIDVKNMGDVTLDSPTVDDPLTADESCPAGAFAPGVTITCTATYVISQSDADTGTIANTATATALDPGGNPVSAEASNVYTVAQTSSLAVAKTGTVADPDGDGIPQPGDMIDYTITVTNDGSVTIDNIAVSDPIGVPVCDAASIAGGGVITCTVSRALTQADIDAGSATNTATADGTDPGGSPVTASDTATTAIVQAPELVVTKSTPTQTLVVGDTLNYSIVAHNTGNVTVDTLAISDPLAPDASCPVTTLGPDDQTVCTASYVVTQADVDAGTVTNTATVTAVSAGGANLSASDTYTVPSTPSPSLAMTKTGVVNDTNSNGMVEAGETIGYTFVVTNTGNVAVTGVAITDPSTTLPVCDSTDLLPGQTTECTASHTLTQTDINAGVVSNTATVNALDPSSAAVSAEASEMNAIEMVPSITADKVGVGVDVDDNGQLDVGETIDYTITVTNTGNVTIDTLDLTDPLTGPPTCDVNTIAPQAVATCTASYILNEAAIDSGSVANNVGVTGLDPWDTQVTASAATTNTITPVASLAVSKTAVTRDVDDSGTIDVGEFIDYTITVTNDGNVTIDGLTVADPVAGDPTCDVTSLASGGTATCLVTLTVTQAHLDAGGVDNTATATGDDPQNNAVEATDTVSTALTTTPSITVAKTGSWVDGDDDGRAEVGETIDFTITVTNDGNVTINNLVVTDPTAGDPTCDATSLSPGLTATCTVTYTLTQADVDAGEMSNTATAASTDPGGNPVGASDTATVTLAPAPALTVAKDGTWVDGDDDGMVDVGESIDYTITVTNTGNVTITNLVVTDPRAGDPTCDATSLAPGAAATCTTSYTITEADIVAGSFANSANAAGTDPSDGPVSSTGTTSTPLVAVPQLEVSKNGTVLDVNGDGVTNPGDQVRYMVMVANTGNVTMSDIAVADPMTGPPICDPTTLAPGASTDCAVIYTITQADIDGRWLSNEATVTGTDPAGVDLSVIASNKIYIDWVPAYTVTKSATVASFTAGSLVNYSIVVRNTGNVTVLGLFIDDSLTTDESCPSDTLAPGVQMTCTATYRLTQADIDAGSIDNTATVFGSDPGGGEMFDMASATTPFTQSPELSVTKTGTPSDDDDNGQIDAGDTVGYVITVTNTGNVTLTALAVSDPMLSDLTCDITELAPGMAATCTGSYTLTQADVDAGTVSNTATAVAKDPDLASVTADGGTVTVIPAEPRLAVDTVATHGDINDDGVFQAGETIGYTATVTNTGNVNLALLAVGDPVVGTFTCDVSALAPGESATCTASHPLTQADIDAGQMSVTITAEGLDPSEDPVAASGAINTALPPAPELVVLKSADVTNPAVGDTIGYTITVANVGNVTVTDIAVVDDLTPDETCSGTTAAPGETITCTATYVVTQADVDRGSLANTATASGTTPAGGSVDATGEATTPFDQRPAFAADKTAVVNDENDDGLPQVDETITYTIRVTNTGNVTLVGVAVEDPTAGTPVCGTSVLAPAEATDCMVTSILTTADLDAGGIDNTATATATAPDDSTLTAEASVTTSLEQAPELGIAKSGELDDTNDNGTPDPGEPMRYTITVSNTGNVTIANILVADTLMPAPGCDVSSLAAGERIECVVLYTLTTADVDRGEVTNTAVVAGITPAGTAVGGQATAVNSLAAAPEVDLTMSGSMAHSSSNAAQVNGMMVEFVLVAANMGNVTLDGVTVTDVMSTDLSCPKTRLAVGERMRCTGTYPVTQADMDAGEIHNHGSVVGTSPAGATVADAASVALPLLIDPKADVVKTGVVVDVDGNRLIEAGDAIDFTITITNTGDVTLSELSVDDPLTGAPTCDSTSIAPGEVATCTVTYTLVEADIATGSVPNTAAVSADYLEKPAVATTEVTLPRANADTATGTGDQPVIIDVLANDSQGLDPDTLRVIDFEGNPVMRAEVVGQGVWSVENGMLVFRAEAGFEGTTRPIVYQASNADGLVVTATAVAVITPSGTTTTTGNDTTTTTYQGPTTSGFDGGSGGSSGGGYPSPRAGLSGGVATLAVSFLAILLGAGLLMASRNGRRLGRRHDAG